MKKINFFDSNLLNKENSKSNLTKYLIVPLAGLFIFITYLQVNQIRSYYFYKQKSILLAQKNEIKNQELNTGITQQMPDLKQILSIISEIIPAKVKLSKFDFEFNKEISLTGFAYNTPALAEFIRSISKHMHWGNIALESICKGKYKKELIFSIKVKKINM